MLSDKTVAKKSSITTLFKPLSFVLLSLFAQVASADYQLNMAPGVTSISQEIYSLHNTILWICVAIGVVVFGVMFFAIFKHRKSKGAQPAQFHDSTVIEIIWTLVPFLILIAMAVPATETLVKMHNSDKADLAVKITGYQWKWKYDYIPQTAEDEPFGFFSSLHEDSRNAITDANFKPENYLLEVDNPLVVPVNKKIRFLITSNDVLHAWWVPAFGVKKDAIPGFINESWTIIEEPGVYRGQCAELCGKDHGFMPIVVVAKAQEEYDAWVKEQQALSAKQVDLSDRSFEWLYDKGQEVYTKVCSVCHQPNGEGLASFPALKGSAVATTGPVEDHIDFILKGRNMMPAFAEQLNDVEIAAVTTYERSAWGNDTGDVVQPRQVSERRK